MVVVMVGVMGEGGSAVPNDPTLPHFHNSGSDSSELTMCSLV